MTRCISFAGLKGGVGKTTQTLSVAYCASNEYDKKVLVVDLDPQSSSSIILGITPNNYDARTPNKDMTQLLKDVEQMDLSYEQDYLDDLEPNTELNSCLNVKGIHTLMNMVLEGQGKSITKKVIQECIHQPIYYMFENVKNPDGTFKKNDRGQIMKEKTWFKYGFDLMPCTEELFDIQFKIANMQERRRDMIVPAIIKMIEKEFDYDYIIIDLAPSLDFLVSNGMMASKSGVIICVSQDKQSLYALSRIKENLRIVKNNAPYTHNGALGIVLTIFDKKHSADRYIEKTVGYDTKLKVFKTKISKTSNAQKSILAGLITPQISDRNYLENCKLFEEIDQQITFLEEKRKEKGTSEKFTWILAINDNGCEDSYFKKFFGTEKEAKNYLLKLSKQDIEVAEKAISNFETDPKDITNELSDIKEINANGETIKMSCENYFGCFNRTINYAMIRLDQIPEASNINSNENF